MERQASDWDDSSHMPAELIQNYPGRLLESTIGIARARSDRRNNGKTNSYRLHDAYLVVSQLRPFANQTLWVDGKLAPHAPFERGSTAIYDLERHWVSDLHDSYDSLHFYLPRAAIEAVAEEVGAKSSLRLCLPPHLNAHDETVHQIGQLLLPVLERPQETSRLFVDHLALALHAHLVHRYGDRPIRAPRAAGGLARWQEQRAKDFMRAHIAIDTTLEEVARECGLSRSYFIKAFRISTGISPHQWVIGERLAQAKDLMRGTSIPLSEIATLCGFADQSHLGRVFRKICGITPRYWRLQTEPQRHYILRTEG